MQVVPVWGVELSSYALRAVKMELGSSGKPRVTAWDIVDYVEEIEDLTDLARHHVMGRALYHFRSRHKLERSRVFMSVRGETAFNRTVVIPPVSDESMDKLLEYEAQQQIPFPLDDVYWDHRVLAIQKDGGIHATLYAVRRALVEDRLHRLAKARFPVDATQLRPIALHNFCAAERYLESGTLVISVDYGVLQVLICHDEHSWFRCLPVGGVDFVARIQETFGTNHRSAVRMASGEGRIADRDKFLECREEAGRVVAEQAAQVVKYYLAARPHIRPQGIVLFQSHRCAPPIATHLKELLDQPVHKPKGFRQIEVDPDVVTAGIQEHFHSLTVAAGLALQGLGKGEIEVRLFPSGLQRQLRGGRFGYVAAAVLLIAFLVWVGIVSRQRADEYRSKSQELHTLIMDWKTVDEYKEQFSPARYEKQLADLARPGEARAGRLPLVETIWEVHDDWQGGEPRPRIVSLALGKDSGAPENKAHLVMAADERNGEAAARAVMTKFVETLQAKGCISGAVAGESWVAGASTVEAPKAAPERPWRIRLRHARYTLDLGGSE